MLIEQGISEELPRDVYEEKRPRLLVSGEFEFERFGVRADFALAQSLFTHLPPEPIQQCLNKLRGSITASGTFYATFFEAKYERENATQPHDHGYFAYTRGQMASFGEQGGWAMDYVGEWAHPRHQKMLRYRPV